MRNIWKDGIMGVVTGDALGCPVQFESRQEVAAHPVTGMRGYGTFNLPAGSWTDDSSLTLALAESIGRLGKIDPCDIGDNFVKWLDHGEFTPFGYAYDIGGATMSSVLRYKRSHDPKTCGGRTEWDNGNGSLMRILPACLYCVEKDLDDSEAYSLIHAVGSLTHAHIRSNIACGLTFAMAKSILKGSGPLTKRLQNGLDCGFKHYEAALSDQESVLLYNRLRDLEAFARLPASEIKSTGYVVDTLEAAVWSLITTESFKDALLRAVNLGHDTDTVGAVCGGLEGLFYGYDSIPEEWLKVIQRREWIEGICDIRLS